MEKEMLQRETKVINDIQCITSTNFCKWTWIKIHFIGKADVTITISDKDFMELLMGKLNPQKLFFQGRLKIKGNMSLAMKIQAFQKKADDMRAKL